MRRIVSHNPSHTAFPGSLHRATEAPKEKRRLTASQWAWVDREPFRTRWRVCGRYPRIAAARIKQEHNLLRRRAHGAGREISTPLLLIGESLLNSILGSPPQGWHKVPALVYVQLQHARDPLTQHRRQQRPHDQEIPGTPHGSCSERKTARNQLRKAIGRPLKRWRHSLFVGKETSSRPEIWSRDRKNRKFARKRNIVPKWSPRRE